MSHESRLRTLRQKFADLNVEVGELKKLRKSAFLAAPPMPQGGQPPMDPAMMQQGAPPVDPATGQPMDPAMMQQGGAMPPGAPPVDPATGMPIDPATGMPMDPAAMGGAPPAPPAAPPIDPALIDQIVGLLEEMGQAVKQQGEQFAQFQQAVTGEMQDLGDTVAGIEKQLVMSDATAAAAKPEGSAW